MKILLGLSGGVDSAVAAYLLKQQGHQVTCCFMQNWDMFTNNDILGNPNLNQEICPQEQDYLDAKAVADLLDLPIIRLNYISEYWDEVFKHFIEEYRKGRTPNPDILCNKYIKFARFLDYALENGFDMIATGHYARAFKNQTSWLLRAVDLQKDQSYFLSQISQKALSHTLFPLGELNKKEVRAMAIKLNLPIALKKDSTGICFIGERKFRSFLQNYIPAKTGDIVDIVTKALVGKHQGVMYYTIGQRKGLALGGASRPYFVVGKDVEKNILFVANADRKDWLISTSCQVVDLNWFNKVPLTTVTSAKFRYRQQDYPVSLLENKGILEVHYPEGIEAVTPGQQVVFYQRELCLGGGTIEEVYYKNKSISNSLDEAINA